jgi:hypothetical protein
MGVKVNWESTVQLGHVIQALGLIITISAGTVAIYYGMLSANAAQDARIDKMADRHDADIRRLDERMRYETTRIDIRMTNDEKLFDRGQNDEKEQLKSMRTSMERIQSSMSQIAIEVARLTGGFRDGIK